MKNNFPTLIELSALNPADADAARFGGKALGLARLRRDGYRTPEGFAVAAVTESPDRWPAEARSGLGRRCAELLAGGPIAVRSSALGEDSERRSFAGLFETSLNVRDVPAAMAAAARTIASGASDRVRSYAGVSGPFPVGVVFQRMISPRAAGVLFTRDPVGRDPASVLEAVAGLGESLVSGRAAPERWRIYRTGFGTIDTRRQSAVAPVLSETEARDIAAAGRALAERWKRDLDLEWALGQDGTVWWLQARPITTGSAWQPPVVVRSVPDADDGPVTVWSTWNIRESLPDPIPRLTWSVFRHALIPVFTRDGLGVPSNGPVFRVASPVDLVDGRICFNMNALLASPILGRRFAKVLGGIDARAGRTTERLLEEGVLRPRKLPWGPGGLMAARLQMAWRALSKLPRLLRPRDAMRTFVRADERLARRLPVADLDDPSLLREVGLLDLPEADALREDGLLFAMAGALSLAAERPFRPWPEARRALAAAGEGTATLKISLGIDDLAAEARGIAGRFSGGTAAEILAGLRGAPPGDPAGRWLRSLDGFLARFGHRTPKELDLSVPRWVEDPAMIVDLVRARLVPGEAGGAGDRRRRLSEGRGRKIDEAVAQAPPWKRPLLRWLARAVPEYLPLREAPKDHVLVAVLRARRAALELGRRLVRRGAMDAAEDVFHLELEELDSLIRRPENARNLVAARRRELEGFRKKPAPDFLRSDGIPVEVPADPAAEEGALRGTGVGAGKAEGPVRILEEPDPRRVRSGDVLVLELADPAWTPLFAGVAAVVMEVGGEMCHAAVIARELGIPAVFGVPEATRILKEGERVRVDGDAGRVLRVGPTPI